MSGILLCILFAALHEQLFSLSWGLLRGIILIILFAALHEQLFSLSKGLLRGMQYTCIKFVSYH